MWEARPATYNPIEVETDRIGSTVQAAKQLRLSRPTLLAWRKRGRILGDADFAHAIRLAALSGVSLQELALGVARDPNRLVDARRKAKGRE